MSTASEPSVATAEQPVPDAPSSTPPLEAPAEAPAAPVTPPVVARSKPRRTHTGASLFLALALFQAAALAGGIALARRHEAREAEATLTRGLSIAPATWEAHLRALAAERRDRVRALATRLGTPSLFALQAPGEETRGVDLDDLAKAQGANIFLFDKQGTLVGRSADGSTLRPNMDASGRVGIMKTLADLRTAAELMVDARGTSAVYLVASAPVMDGETARHLGAVAAAFPIGDAEAKQMAEVTGTELAVLANLAAADKPAELGVVAATRAIAVPDPPGHFADRTLALRVLQDAKATRPRFEFSAGDRRFAATAVAIRLGEGDPVALAVLALEKPKRGATADLQRGLFLMAATLVLAALPVSLFLARRARTPIRQLGRAAQEIADGKLDVELPQFRGDLGLLSRALSAIVSAQHARNEASAATTTPAPAVPAAPAASEAQGAAPEPIENTSSLEVGSVFAGRYEVLQVLGEGGMGRVLRVKDRELDDEVALKALKPTAQGDAAGETLRQEIRLARMVTHPNVVRVHHFAEAGGVRFFTMEYVLGKTLHELLDQRRLLDLVPAMQIGRQICRGLAAVHKAGIVHGDLKSQNVMVMEDGAVKLMDFGVARSRTLLERGGGPFAGTPAYMSPEQARGGDLDERSDIYSAGVVLFELFTGRCPFLGGTAEDVMRMHLNDTPPNPRRLRPELPESAAQIVLACLSKSRVHRPPSAAELDRLLLRVRV